MGGNKAPRHHGGAIGRANAAGEFNPYGYGPPAPREPLDARAESPPLRRAAHALFPRMTFDRRGNPVLDGRPASAREAVRQANEVLARRGERPIDYPLLGLKPKRTV